MRRDPGRWSTLSLGFDRREGVGRRTAPGRETPGSKPSDRPPRDDDRLAAVPSNRCARLERAAQRVLCPGLEGPQHLTGSEMCTDECQSDRVPAPPSARRRACSARSGEEVGVPPRPSVPRPGTEGRGAPDRRLAPRRRFPYTLRASFSGGEVGCGPPFLLLNIPPETVPDPAAEGPRRGAGNFLDTGETEGLQR